MHMCAEPNHCHQIIKIAGFPPYIFVNCLHICTSSTLPSVQKQTTMAIRKLTQTGQPTDRLDLEPMKDRLPPVTIDPERVVDAFEAALESLPLGPSTTTAAVTKTAESFAAKIQAMVPCPPVDHNSGYPHADLGGLFITIAADIPSRHVGQDLLVATVRAIKASPEPAWGVGFFKSLGMMMRDDWNGKPSVPVQCPNK